MRYWTLKISFSNSSAILVYRNAFVYPSESWLKDVKSEFCFRGQCFDTQFFRMQVLCTQLTMFLCYVVDFVIFLLYVMCKQGFLHVTVFCFKYFIRYSYFVSNTLLG